MLAKIEEVRSTESPVIQTARDEIKRLRSSADTQIANSQTLIQKLREEIKIDGGADVDVIIDEQTARIKTANTEIDTLTEEKYTIEAEYRKLEAEVGPIKYIAEFIYEEADRDILEQAVRWVIITIIFVFDPLAVLLLIASQYTFEWRRQDGKNLRPMVESTPTIYGSDDGEKDDQPIQEEHVESDERNREASDKESLSGRSDVEPNEEQVPDSDEAQERTSTEQDTGGSATASEQVKEEIRDEIEELLEQADPEVLEEVAKELDIEKQVDNDLYDPYNDNRPCLLYTSPSPRD